MNYSCLIKMVCVAAGLILTRLATTVPVWAGIILSVISIALFIAPIAHDLYTHYTKAQEHKIHKLLWQLPVVCTIYFIMLLGIRWLQGKPSLLYTCFDTITTLNIAVILTYFFYVYLEYIRPRFWRLTKNRDLNPTSTFNNEHAPYDREYNRENK